MSYGGCKSPKVNIQGHTLTTREEYKYLGYIENKKSRAAKHMRDRSIKMKKALNFFLGITEALDRLPIKRRQIMAKACVETVGLYGTEVMPTEVSYSRIREEMEIAQRKFARVILNANQSTANEVVTMELKLSSVKALMDFKLLIFRERMMREKGTLNALIFHLNKTRNLDWEKRCKKILKEYGIEDCKNREEEKRNTDWKWRWEAREKIYMKEAERRREALNQKKTTSDFIRLGGTIISDLPEYLTHNSNMKFATGLIFQLRGGSNFTNACKYTRHLTQDPTCPSCGAEVEDTRHLIEKCEAYQEERDDIRKYLEKTLGNITKKHNIEEITLGENIYEEELKETINIDERKEIDRQIKRFIEKIFKKRRQYEKTKTTQTTKK